MKIAEALKRVLVREDPTQDEAVITEIDRSGGVDVVTLVINPALVDAVALTGYKIKAAITSSLEGLARYNRQIKDKYGTYVSDELVFAEGYERAMTELEELVHLAPRADTGEQPAPAAPASPAQETADPTPAPEAQPAGPASGGGDDGQPDAQLESAPVPGATDQPGAESGH